MDVNSKIWQNFLSHVMKWETGVENPTTRQGLTADQNDPAASCNPGKYHTNKGVTFCTFKSLGQKVGVTPITYERFLNLTKQDAGKFLLAYYQQMQGDKLTPKIGLSLCEASWGSGPGTAVIHLQDALNLMGKKVNVDGVLGPNTIAAANSVSQSTLYDNYWKIRIDYLKSLGRLWSTYGVGWMNRVNSFIKNTSKASIGIGIIGIAIIVSVAAYYITTDKEIQKQLSTLPI